MERAEAEAIYDAGRDACVEVLLRLAGQVDRHEARLARLEEQARADSRNSSVAPSADPPKSRQQRRAEARLKAKGWAKREGGAPRKAGKQPGAPGSGRRLLPEDQIDEFAHHYPDACGGCGHEFSDEEKLPSRRPGRHQVAELPPVTVVYTEHRTHRLRCPDCKTKTAAVLPESVAASAFGPRIQAAVVTLTARNRVSRRDMSELVRELFGLGLSGRVGRSDLPAHRPRAERPARGADRSGPRVPSGQRRRNRLAHGR